MSLTLACIVEGHGEIEAVPVTIRRIAQLVDPGLVVNYQLFRIPRTKLVKQGELERAVELAGRRAGRDGAIVIVLDSDDDCPATLGPELLIRVRRTRSDLPVSVVLAKREFEA